jgi:hypothetical protein
MQVTVDEIERYCTEMIKTLKDVCGNVVEIPFEVYWDTLSPDRYDVYKEASHLGLADLQEDLNALREAVNEDPKRLQLWHITPLSAILRATVDATLADDKTC